MAYPHTSDHPSYGNETPVKPVVVEDPPEEKKDE